MDLVRSKAAIDRRVTTLCGDWFRGLELQTQLLQEQMKLMRSVILSVQMAKVGGKALRVYTVNPVSGNPAGLVEDAANSQTCRSSRN